MKNTSIDQATKNILRYLIPGKSCLLFISANNSNFLEELSVRMSMALGKDEHWPIYIVQGSIRGEYEWSFSKLRKGPRLKLLTNGETVTEVGGLILPQDRPIILLAEEFDMFDSRNQNAYSHLIDMHNDALSLTLYPGSILIAGLVESNKGELDMGVANKGVHQDFTE